MLGEDVRRAPVAPERAHRLLFATALYAASSEGLLLCSVLSRQGGGEGLGW